MPYLKCVKEGRFNPKNVSYFYISSVKDIAIKEIKVSDRKDVTVATFKSNTDLRISDLYILKKVIDAKLLNWVKNMTNIEYNILKFLLSEISKPIHKYNESEYLITQYIFDYIKNTNNLIDGFKYHSSLGNAVNYVFFDDNKFTLEDMEQRKEGKIYKLYKNE